MTELRDVSDELIAAAIRGDRRALGSVLVVVRPLVMRYCRARLARTAHEAVDGVAHEVCQALLDALPGYHVQHLPFLAFVHDIAARIVVDAQRSNRLPLRVERTSDAMTRMVENVPEQEREILVLRVAVGLSAEETAEALGSTPTAVRLAQHRALDLLRRDMLGEKAV